LSIDNFDSQLQYRYIDTSYWYAYHYIVRFLISRWNYVSIRYNQHQWHWVKISNLFHFP